MSIIHTSSPRVQQLAREGLARQGGKTFTAARSEGTATLDRIAAEAGSSLEGTYARAVRAAASQRLYDQSAYSTQNLGLQALANGVSGPIGPALATLGNQAIYKTVWHDASQAWSDGRTIGSSLLDAIATNGAPGTETTLAQVARAAVAPRMYNQSAFQVEGEALSRLAGNVQGADTVKTLADFGRAARMKCLDNGDARTVAGPVLQAIEGAGDARATVIAEAARVASQQKLRPDAASRAQDAGFVRILSTPKTSLQAELARVGQDALEGCSYADDQRTLGHAFLQRIGEYATTEAVRQTAQVANAVTRVYLYNRSAAAAQRAAFSLIENASPTAEPTRMLADLGKGVAARAETFDDARTMGDGVLSALFDRETDPVRKAVAGAARTLAGRAASSNVAHGVQQFAFDWLTQPAVASSPAQWADPSDTDAAVLVEKRTFNERLGEALANEITKRSADSTARLTQMQQLADRFNPIAERVNVFGRRVVMAHRAMYGSLCAAGFGMMLGPWLPTPVGAALVVGGVASARISIAVMNRMHDRNMAEHGQYVPLRQRYDQLEAERSVIETGVTAARASLANVNDAIRSCGGALEVVKMAEQPAPSPAVIKVTDAEVSIGGVRLKRAPARPTPDEASVPAEGGA